MHSQAEDEDIEEAEIDAEAAQAAEAPETENKD